MPSDTPSIFVIADVLIFLGLVGAAVAGVWFFFSPSYRARKQKQWSEEGNMKAVSEWGDWLLGLLVVVVFLSALAGAYLREWL